MAALNVVATYDLLCRDVDFDNEARGLEPVSIAAKIVYYQKRAELLLMCSLRTGRMPTYVMRWSLDGSPVTLEYGRPGS